MKTFTINLSGCDLENFEVLKNSTVYHGLTEEQILENVLMCAMHEEAKLYKELDSLRKESKVV